MTDSPLNPLAKFDCRQTRFCDGGTTVFRQALPNRQTDLPDGQSRSHPVIEITSATRAVI
jgi:hypothetical protein